jgi:hypothetical protein
VVSGDKQKYRNQIENVRQRIPCNSCKMANFSLSDRFFLFHNQFYLSIHSNHP